MLLFSRMSRSGIEDINLAGRQSEFSRMSRPVWMLSIGEFQEVGNTYQLNSRRLMTELVGS